MTESKFLTPLDVRVLRSRTLTRRPSYKLLSTFKYYSLWFNSIIEVPTGFITDFASIPVLPFLWGLFGDVADYPAVIHDYLYRTPMAIIRNKRIDADTILYEAMSAVTNLPEFEVDDPAIPWLPAKVIYWGVRLGGKGAWHGKC